MDTSAHKAVALEVKSVSKHFATAQGNISILENTSFVVHKGEKVAIVGPSGSGKSTLLSLIGLLDSPSSGQVFIGDRETSQLSENELAELRNSKIGFVFQAFELISPFTVSENIAAPVEIGERELGSTVVDTLLSEVGLEHRKDALPFTLSGGEKQRVAIARALSNEPEIILADEPTGSLDRQTGEKILSLLLATADKNGKTLIVITHDESIAAQMDRVFEIRERAIHERR